MFRHYHSFTASPAVIEPAISGKIYFPGKDTTLPPKPQTPNADSEAKKDLVNKDGTVTKLVELATADINSIEDLQNLFQAQGVEYSKGEELTHDFRLITGDEKQLFLQRVQGEKVGVIKWNFITNAGQREFVAVHVLIEGHGKFIINDSSQGGFYGQLASITATRMQEGWAYDRAHAGLIAPGGFKQNKEFYYRTACPEHGSEKQNLVKDCEYCQRIGKAIARSEVDDVPSTQKEKARPTWRLDFQ
jgi:hypothetical protein